MVETAEKYGAEKGVKVIAINAEGKAEKQQSDLEDLISRGVNVIVIDVCNISALNSAITNAVKKGVPVIAVDSRVEAGTPISSFITADNFTIGYNVGYAMGKNWNSKETPNAVIISGAVGDYEGWQRREGFVSGFMEYQYEKFGGGGLNVLAQRFPSLGWDGESASKEMDDMLVKFGGKIDMFFSESDVMTIPCLKRVQAANQSIKIVGSIDGQREAIELIKSGQVAAVGVNSSVLMAKGGIDQAIALMSGQTIPANIYVDSPTITKENFDKFYDPNKPFQ